MPVAIVLAALVILGGIIVVAMGKGGEMSRERPELAARTDFRSWRDVADYRPPAALLGYHAAATERALALIARTIAERDAEIDWLRKRLAEFQPERAGGVAEAEDLAADDGAGEAAFVPDHAALPADEAIPPTDEANLAADQAMLPAAKAVLGGAEAAFPAEESWQAGGSEPGVAAGYAAYLPSSRSLGEHE